MRKFNSTGLCVPEEHYMADLAERVRQVRTMVEAGDYLCVNRARQYGKTTLLAALERSLASDYIVVSLDFQEFSHASFSTEGAFVQEFCEALLEARDSDGLKLDDTMAKTLRGICRRDYAHVSLPVLFRVLRSWLRESPLPVVHHRRSRQRDEQSGLPGLLGRAPSALPQAPKEPRQPRIQIRRTR